MSKYGYMVKYGGKYYKTGEEVPDDVKPEIDSPKTEEKKETVKPVNNPPTQLKASTVAAAAKPQMQRQ